MTDEELFDQAREVNFTYKAAVADVQLQIFDGDWVLERYGDTPRTCGDDGYEFRFGRSTPEGWRIDGTPAEAAAQVGAWLDENGWTDIKTRTYTDGIADVVVEAEKPDAHVARLTVDISPGEFYDSATIYADSTCEPGDAHTISELRRPGSPDDTDQLEMQPETEHPTAEPSFGYTADGKRRFWTDDTE